MEQADLLAKRLHPRIATKQSRLRTGADQESNSATAWSSCEATISPKSAPAQFSLQICDHILVAIALQVLFQAQECDSHDVPVMQSRPKFLVVGS